MRRVLEMGEATRMRACVVCGLETSDYTIGWDDRARCVDHTSQGPRPFDRSAAEYLILGDEGHIEVIHEPCGETLLVTLRVHLDTLTRLAREHTCDRRGADQ